MTNPTAKQKEEARESLFAVVGEIGGVWATFDTREKAERYPGPRMMECAARTVVEYVPATLLSSRDAEIREVLEGLRGLQGSRNCWCDADADDDHYLACLAARRVWERVQVTNSTST